MPYVSTLAYLSAGTALIARYLGRPASIQSCNILDGPPKLLNAAQLHTHLARKLLLRIFTACFSVCIYQYILENSIFPQPSTFLIF